MSNVFETLNNINVNDYTETKNNLTYLSWSWAWKILKSNFPDSNYTIYENNDGRFYFDDGRTCWVKTGVTVNGLEHIEYLPVMDYRNQSITVDKVTSTDVNRAIQRSLTKSIARHGLGLYIYAGEDLPDSELDEHKAATKNVLETPIDEPKRKTLLKEMERTGVSEKKLFYNLGVSSWEEININGFKRAMEVFKTVPSK